MRKVLTTLGRGVALALLVAALGNLCISLKLAICGDDTYVGKVPLILPLMLMSFGLWAIGCLLNRVSFQRRGRIA